jgi:DNA-directed RNA polymerase subunit RPC12/RpoP
MQQPQLTQEHLKNSKQIVCEECEHNIFEEKLMLRKVSKLLIGADKDQIIPIPVICCAKCGYINEEFQPNL